MLGSPCSPCCGGGACACGVIPTQIVAQMNAFPGASAIPPLTFNTLPYKTTNAPGDFASRFPLSVLISSILTRDDSIALYGGYGYRYVGDPLASGPDLYDSGDGYVLRRNAIDIRFWFYPAANHPTLSPVIAGTAVCYRFGMSYADGWLWQTHPTNSTFQFGRSYTVDGDDEWSVVSTAQPPQPCLQLRDGGSLLWGSTTYTDNWQYGLTSTQVGIFEVMSLSIS